MLFLTILPATLSHLCPTDLTMASVASVLFLLGFSFSFIKGDSDNCTSNCVNFRRDWPQFDFEFYYEHSGDTPPSIDPSGLSYTLHPSLTPTVAPKSSIPPSFSPNTSQVISPTISLPSVIPTTAALNSTNHQPEPSWQTTTSSMPPVQPTGTIQLGKLTSLMPYLHTAILLHNCTWEESVLLNQSLHNQSFIEDYLLRTVFKNTNFNQSMSRQELVKYLGEKLLSIYQYGLKKQSKELQPFHRIRRQLATNQTEVDLDVVDLQVDESRETVDVIYYVKKKGILVPYEDASKIMSFVSNSTILNVTGYEIVHKVQPYNVMSSLKTSTVSSWFSMATLVSFLALILFLLLCIVLLYRMYVSEKQKWLDRINKELNRVMPSDSLPEQEGEDNSHWNYAASTADSGSNSPRNEDQHNKLDKSSQYDYGSWKPVSHFQGHSSERLIPKSDPANSDYDRISYVRSQETIQETVKSPNILEIRLSEETRSIVKEIRRELSRYNQRKILRPDHEASTSDA